MTPPSQDWWCVKRTNGKNNPQGVHKAMLLQKLIYNFPNLALGFEEERFFTVVEFHYGNSTKSLLIGNVLRVWSLTGGTPFFSWGMTLPFGFLLQPRWFPGTVPKCASHCFHWLFKTVLCIGLRSLWWQGEKNNAYEKMLAANSEVERICSSVVFLRGEKTQNLQLNSYVLELLLFHKLF